MSIFRTAIGLCALTSLTLLNLEPAHAQRGASITTPVPKQYSYDLQITGIAAGPYVENQPVNVDFTITVRSFGISGELPPPRQGTICGARKGDTCRPLGALSADRVIRGSVNTSAQAGQSSPFKITLSSPEQCVGGLECFGSSELAETAVSHPVAARYMLSVDEYTILTPRSYLEDSVTVNLFGSVDGQRSSLPDACNIEFGPRYCAINIQQGEHSEGTYEATNTEVGPFDQIPETDPDLKFSYILLNVGTTYEQRVAQKIFNGISDATAAALAAYTGSQGGDQGSWGGVNDFTHGINAMQFGGCDGPVAVDVRTALNRSVGGNASATIYGRTDESGVFTAKGPRDAAFYEIDSQDGCGRSGRYTVQWTVRRISWLPPID